MWAWPVAITRCVPDAGARAPSSGREHGACGGDVGARRRAPARACAGSRARRGSVERHRAHQPVEHVEVVHERLGVAVDQRQVGAAEAVQRLVAGGAERTRAATARTAGTTGSTPLRAGSSAGPAWPRRRWLVRRGWMPCTGRPASSTISPSHWNPAASARNPRSITASTRRPAHWLGDRAGEREPGRAPRRPPHRRRQRTAPARSSVGPAVIVSGTPLALDERQHPLVQLARDPLLDQPPVGVHQPRRYAIAQALTVPAGGCRRGASISADGVGDEPVLPVPPQRARAAHPRRQLDLHTGLAWHVDRIASVHAL